SRGAAGGQAAEEAGHERRRRARREQHRRARRQLLLERVRDVPDGYRELRIGDEFPIAVGLGGMDSTVARRPVKPVEQSALVIGHRAYALTAVSASAAAGAEGCIAGGDA